MTRRTPNPSQMGHNAAPDLDCVADRQVSSILRLLGGSLSCSGQPDHQAEKSGHNDPTTEAELLFRSNWVQGAPLRA
jgi:hypothetical protein